MKLGTVICLSPGHIMLDGDPAPAPKGAQPPIFGPCLLWSNGWMDQDATWYGGRPQRRQHCIRWGGSYPEIKETQQPPTVRPMYCGQTGGWIKMPLGTKVGLGPGHIVLDGPSSPPPKKRGAGLSSPQFSAHVCCGQTAGWIKMPLGREVDLRGSAQETLC